jgi:L-threonylcarbamoyladenylate synthase
VSRIFSTTDPDERARGLKLAAQAVRRGDLVVLPTDTVYGIGADAFTPTAVAALLEAKGRGRDMPVPVLVGSPQTAEGLAEFDQRARDLAEAFWPGALTLVVRHQPSLAWDLGDARGTVAVRMPLHPVALELLRDVGPMAVSSANRSGQQPAPTGELAREQLGEAVAIYLEAGVSPRTEPSTIVDLTGEEPLLLRAGALDADVLRTVVPRLRVSG